MKAQKVMFTDVNNLQHVYLLVAECLVIIWYASGPYAEEMQSSRIEKLLSSEYCRILGEVDLPESVLASARKFIEAQREMKTVLFPPPVPLSNTA